MIEQAALKAGIPVTVQRVGTMLTPFFTDQAVTNYRDVRSTDREAFARFFHRLLAEGVYLPPSPFEAAFTSSVHGPEELTRLEEALAQWARQP